LSRRYERVEAEAFGDLNLVAGLPVLRVAGAVCCATPGVDSPMLNRVMGLGIEEDPTDADLDEIDSFYRGAGVRYYVSLAPAAQQSVDGRLRERGFVDGYAWMKFSRGPEPAPIRETTLVVEPTQDGGTFFHIVSAAFDLPPDAPLDWDGVAGRPNWHLFLALDAGEPVAAAALFAHEGVGWIGAAGTLGEHRGKGAQGALLAARIERARELGVDALVTETGQQLPGRPSGSYRNILRAGFAEAYLRPNLLSPH
jgi:GNAT superfamily N-acetyltransferase